MTEYYTCSEIGDYVSTQTTEPTAGMYYTLALPPFAAGYSILGYRYFALVEDANGAFEMQYGIWMDVDPLSAYQNGYQVQTIVHDQMDPVVADINNDIAAVGTQVSAVELDLSTAQGFITSLQGSVSSLASSVSTLNTANKRTEVYQGTTDSNGEYKVVYATPFPAGVVPHVSVEFINTDSTNLRTSRLTASSNTGFTVKIEQRASSLISLLGINLILGGTTNVTSAVVSVLVRAP